MGSLLSLRGKQRPWCSCWLFDTDTRRHEVPFLRVSCFTVADRVTLYGNFCQFMFSINLLFKVSRRFWVFGFCLVNVKSVPFMCLTFRFEQESNVGRRPSSVGDLNGGRVNSMLFMQNSMQSLTLTRNSRRYTSRRQSTSKVRFGDATDDVHVCIMCLRAIMNHQVDRRWRYFWS